MIAVRILSKGALIETVTHEVAQRNYRRT